MLALPRKKEVGLQHYLKKAFWIHIENCTQKKKTNIHFGLSWEMLVARMLAGESLDVLFNLEVSLYPKYCFLSVSLFLLSYGRFFCLSTPD